MRPTPFKFNLITVFFVSLFAASSCSKLMHDKTGEEVEREMAVKNKIKTIAQYKTPVMAGIDQKEQLVKIEGFDINGFKKKVVNYNSDSGIETIAILEYDKNGNLVFTKGINKDSSLAFTETRSYDEHGNRKELYFYHPDGTFEYKNIAAYDNEGRRIELAWYWPPPIGFRSKNVYTYEGREKTEDTEYGADGKFRYKWLYKYDGEENLIEAIQYYPGNVINCKITYQFNKNNKLIKQVNYIGESVQSISTFVYDDKNLLTSKTESSPNGRVTARFRFQYEFYNFL